MGTLQDIHPLTGFEFENLWTLEGGWSEGDEKLILICRIQHILKALGFMPLSHLCPGWALYSKINNCRNETL